MTHQLNRGGMSNGLSNNNYYGFSTPHTNNNNRDDPVTNAEQELAGGGLSFVIHSPTSKNQQQLGSISSVASVSSGISSGSSTITKSSGFNGNTFTRSKPKERKPLPNAWQLEQEKDEQDDYHEGSEEPAAANANTPLKGKGLFPVVIPSVTLSEATPPKKKSSSSYSTPSSASPGSSPNSKDLAFCSSKNDSSNSSTSDSIAQSGRARPVFSIGNGTSNNDYEEDVTDDNDNSSLNFQPGACSTFILTEGEEFPEERGVGRASTSKSATATKQNRNSDIAKRSIRPDKSAINNDDVVTTGAGANSSTRTGSNVFSIPGISKMKAEKSSAEQKQSDGAAAGVESPNGSSSGIHSNFSGEEENFECLAEGSESFTFQESCGSGETSLQYSR